MTGDGMHGVPCAICDAPRWRVLLDLANATPRCGAKCKRTGLPCRSAAMRNGRCRMHGGRSTGPRTADAVARCAAVATKHGGRNAAARARAAERGEGRRFLDALRQLLKMLE